MNTFEKRQTKDALEKCIVIESDLSHLVCYSCLSISSPLADLRKCITKLGAILDGEN